MIDTGTRLSLGRTVAAIATASAMLLSCTEQSIVHESSTRVVVRGHVANMYHPGGVPAGQVVSFEIPLSGTCGSLPLAMTATRPEVIRTDANGYYVAELVLQYLGGKPFCVKVLAAGGATSYPDATFRWTQDDVVDTIVVNVAP